MRWPQWLLLGQSWQVNFVFVYCELSHVPFAAVHSVFGRWVVGSVDEHAVRVEPDRVGNHEHVG